MKRIILCVVFVLYAFVGFAQTGFPQSWVGQYAGNLEVYAVDSVAMQIKMKLDIQATVQDSVFTWVITYDFKGKEDVRSYELIVLNSKKGLYQIDEKNSIVIESYFRNNVLTSFFEVNKSIIIASYIKQTEAIVFEIIASKNEIVSKTGNTTIDDEDIPEVLSYPIKGRQRAVLHKVKE